MNTTDAHKKEEITHYDQKARAWLSNTHPQKWNADVHGVRHDIFSSYRFCEQWLNHHCKDKVLLDYGCGTGIHSIFPAWHGAKVIGIDLSEESLKIARARVSQSQLSSKVSFQIMDCEHLEFPDNFFDLIFDGGTFSSIELSQSLSELTRVLKPDGAIIGIETFGHNPLANLKRKWNVMRRVRTLWAEQHIIKSNDFVKAKSFFDHIEKYYFHLLSVAFIPFLKIPGVPLLFHIFDRLDRLLLSIPFLQKYAFKVVFIFSKPKGKPYAQAPS